MIAALIDGAIKRRKVVLGVTLIACLFGLGSYLSMPREAQPDIDLPYISVIVPFPGVSPEDAERLLIKPLEVQLQTIQGIKHMNGVARQGAAIVTLEFEPEFSKEKALADVRAKTDLARGRFPPDAEEPIIQEESFADRPIIGVVLHGEAPERELARISKSLKERLESSPGVQEAFESGAREELLDVTI
ncbi:MAG: AcrB/AcrD/AcrF family protein, partial [Phenylobacterium sp.]|nr:AcrB/AcrD/AcrF family protein [Phenylobacterium sp.]